VRAESRRAVAHDAGRRSPTTAPAGGAGGPFLLAQLLVTVLVRWDEGEHSTVREIGRLVQHQTALHYRCLCSVFIAGDFTPYPVVQYQKGRGKGSRGLRNLSGECRDAGAFGAHLRYWLREKVQSLWRGC